MFWARRVTEKKHARKKIAAATVAKGRILLTGRTDNFIQGRPDLYDTIKRLTAFAEAGADVLYAPYPTDMDAVRAIVRAEQEKRWLEDNRAAIEAYNERVSRDGLLSDEAGLQ